MRCTNCGKVNAGNFHYCDACGTKLIEEVPNEVNLFGTEDYNKIVEKMANSETYKNKYTVGALVCGILSIFFCLLNLFVPFVHIVGIVLGSIAVSISAKFMKLKVQFSVGAFVTGLIGIIFGIICIIIGYLGIFLL